MTSSPALPYTLLDFGNARRLERFGSFVIDRPCPAAAGFVPDEPLVWKKADFRFIERAAHDVADSSQREMQRGIWLPSVPPSWTVSFDALKLQLRGTPFGHLGIFPEQQENWRRIIRFLQSDNRQNRPAVRRVLNLFAYTGGSSLAAAMSSEKTSVETVHVDSSKSVVEWAKQNAKQNGVENTIRFITEDARKFVKRELKRGNRYDAVILDPPTYGHGVKGETWKIADDLPELLTDLNGLLTDEPLFFLLTAHSTTLDANALRKIVLEARLFQVKNRDFFSMTLSSQTGKHLPSGCGVLCF